MKVGTLNVNGFVTSATKRSHIFNFISKEKLDIICDPLWQMRLLWYF